MLSRIITVALEWDSGHIALTIVSTDTEITGTTHTDTTHMDTTRMDTTRMVIIPTVHTILIGDTITILMGMEWVD